MEVQTYTPIEATSVPIPRSDADSALGQLLHGGEKGGHQAEWIDAVSGARLGIANALFRSLHLKHPPTARHSLRVALASSTFAQYLGISGHRRRQIELAALLHDIGKIGVPDHILNKPSRLDADEAQVMELHRSAGIKIVSACSSDQEMLQIIRHAGTWYDGTRPTGSRVIGDDIPVGARIVAILDAFDSMTTDLIYRRALRPDHAFAELYHHSSTQFDPKLVIAFAEAYTQESALFRTMVARRWVESTSEASLDSWSLNSGLFDSESDCRAIFQRSLLEAMHDGVVFVDLSGRIVVWNRGAERLTGLSPESVCHKSWTPQLVDMRDMQGNAIKGKNCPLTQCLRARSQGMYRFEISNGIGRVAVNVHVVPVRDEEGNCHGATMLLHDVSPETSLEERVQNLHEKATTDPLTQVANRAEFDRRHQELILTHSEAGLPSALIIADVDKFKSINDTYGHQAGDEALISFARHLQDHCREGDLVARYGGEEFVILCPDCTFDEAIRKAEEIRRTLAATSQPALNGKTMTASFGVTEFLQGDTPESMLRRSDRGLYQAKETGRNRVVPVGPSSSEDEAKRNSIAAWFGWTRKAEEHLVQRILRSSVPQNVVVEKIRGFISDHDAEVLETKESFVSICVDERALPMQRRQSDRPTALTMELLVRRPETGESGTLIEVTIRPRRSRDRRKDASIRADQLLNSLRSYLMAEDFHGDN